MIVFKTQLKHNPDNNIVSYCAPAPAQFISSISGYSLPFANKEQALNPTPNKGKAHVNENNEVSVKLLRPNSYYTNLGTVLLPPTIFISYTSSGVQQKESFKVADSVPYRTLTYANEKDWFKHEDCIASQNTILLKSGICKEPISPHQRLCDEDDWSSPRK